MDGRIYCGQSAFVRKFSVSVEMVFAFRLALSRRFEVFGGRGTSAVCGCCGEAHAGAVGDVAEFVGVVRFAVSAAEMVDHRFVVLGYLEVDDVALGAGECGRFGVVAVYADGEDVAERCVGCFHGDVAGCLYCGGVDFLPVDGPAGGFEEFVEEHSLRAGVAVPKRVQDGGFAPVIGESVDGAVFRESLGEVVFGDSAEDECGLVFDVFGSAVWEVHADGAGVAGAEGACPVVDVLQDELVDLFQVFEVEITCDGL